MISYEKYYDREIIEEASFYHQYNQGTIDYTQYIETVKINGKLLKLVYEFNEEEVQVADESEDLSHLDWDVEHIRKIEEVE